MPAYLTLSDFKLATDMPASFVDELEARTPGWLDKRLELESAYIDSRLRKRYLAPFSLTDTPVAVQRWLTDFVTFRAWRKRGVHALDDQMVDYRSAAEKADAEIKEAADSDTGLFDLPLRPDDAKATAIKQGFTQSYSEASPYVWMTVQERIAREEDDAGEGSYR